MTQCPSSLQEDSQWWCFLVGVWATNSNVNVSSPTLTCPVRPCETPSFSQINTHRSVGYNLSKFLVLCRNKPLKEEDKVFHTLERSFTLIKLHEYLSFVISRDRNDCTHGHKSPIKKNQRFSWLRSGPSWFCQWSAVSVPFSIVQGPSSKTEPVTFQSVRTKIL